MSHISDSNASYKTVTFLLSSYHSMVFTPLRFCGLKLIVFRNSQHSSSVVQVDGTCSERLQPALFSQNNSRFL